MTALLLKHVNDLKPYPNNARIHSKEQINKVANSIMKFGWTNPILIGKDDVIIAGHCRLLAAKKMKLETVPCIDLSSMSIEDARAYVIADNKLALDAGWDNDLLKLELSELNDLGFDLDVIGFSADELDAILNDNTIADGLTDDDAVPTDVETRCKLGDVWLLGEHRLMCGDSTAITDVDKLVNNAKVDMVFTDPPYGLNVVQNNKIGGDKPFGNTKGKTIKANIYAPIIGDETTNCAIDSYHLCTSLDIPIMIFWGANYYASALKDSSAWVVWDKENTGNFADCELAWTNQNRATRIFKHMWNGMIKASEQGQARVHPTQKPIELALWCFKEYAPDSKTVLDLFGGSGSTLIACEKSKRKCFMMELSPNYCDVIIKRYEDFTGNKAVLEVLNG